MTARQLRRCPKCVGLLVISATIILSMTAACSSFSRSSSESNPPLPTNDIATPAAEAKQSAQPSTPAPSATTLVASQITLSPSNKWLVVLQKTPYPYTTPLPPPTQTPLDGIYVKLEPKEGTPVPCRRCPDYLPEGGIWKLNLDRGMYRIFHEATGWFSVGSFTVSDDQLILFNDPTCIDTVGLYQWSLADGELKLTALADTCQVERRARSFANLGWASCQPPNTEAAVTAHWPQPSGCNSGE